MDDFVRLSPEERRIFFEGTATARNVQAQIMEKDFWVCWTLKEMFRLTAIGEHLIFKGGTSLSKVFGLIEMVQFAFLCKSLHSLASNCRFWYEWGGCRRA